MFKFIVNLLLKNPAFRRELVFRALSTAYIDKEQNAILKLAFTDSKGRKYFRYIRDELMPLQRYEQMQVRLLEVESRISRESLTLYAQANRKMAEKKDFIGVATLCSELEERLNILYDPEIMVKFLSGILIREDQVNTAHIWNNEFENEKADFLMKDNQDNNLSFFFRSLNLERYVIFLDTSNTDLMTEPIIQNQLMEVKLFDTMIKKVLISLSQQSLNGKQTEKAI